MNIELMKQIGSQFDKTLGGTMKHLIKPLGFERGRNDDLEETTNQGAKLPQILRRNMKRTVFFEDSASD